MYSNIVQYTYSILYSTVLYTVRRVRTCTVLQYSVVSLETVLVLNKYCKPHDPGQESGLAFRFSQQWDYSLPMQ